MFRINRRIIVSSCSTAALAALYNPTTHCDPPKIEWPFDTKNILQVVSGGQNQNPMFLAAVGMRKKNLYVVEVDVYSVGLCLDRSELHSTKEWYKSNRELPLAQKLIKQAHEAKQLTATQPKIMLILRFVRDVSQQQILHAFTDAFKACSQSSTDDFLAVLKKVAGEKGMKSAEELHFTWLNGGGLTVSKRDEIQTISQNNELETHLLNIYINPEGSVSINLVFRVTILSAYLFGYIFGVVSR